MSILGAMKRLFTVAVDNSSHPTHSAQSADDLSASEKDLLATISRINASGQHLPSELYQQLRDFQMAWLERHYDFNTINGIEAIPVSRNTPGAPSPDSFIKGHTGEVYYYLRYKAYKYEEVHKADLALACMRKSIALLKCRRCLDSGEYYPFVRMLARHGYKEEAIAEKASIEQFCIRSQNQLDDNMIEYEYQKWVDSCTLTWLREHCPGICPKTVTGYRRIKSQNTKNYQLLRRFAAEHGRKI